MVRILVDQLSTSIPWMWRNPSKSEAISSKLIRVLEVSERDLGDMCLNEKLVRFIRAMLSNERTDTPSLTSLS